MCRALFAEALAAIALLGSFSPSMAAEPLTHYRTVTVGDIKGFYREAGDPKAAPPFSQVFRPHRTCSVIRSRCWRTAITSSPPITRDLASRAPDRTQFKYTLIISRRGDGWVYPSVGLQTRYFTYIFDYGVPLDCGWRWPIRSASPPSSRRTATPTQEGLSAGFAGRLKASREPTEQARTAWRAALTPEAGQRRYLTGVTEAHRVLVAPEAFALDRRSALRGRAMMRFSSIC